MVKKLLSIVFLGLFISACNQGDYTYTRTAYEGCMCDGGNEFTCSWHAFGAALQTPWYAPGSQTRQYQRHCR